MNWYDFLLRNRGEVIERTAEHIGLVATSMAIALIIGLPLGVALVRRRAVQRQTIAAKVPVLKESDLARKRGRHRYRQ